MNNNKFVELIEGCKYHYKPLPRWEAEGEDGGTILVTWIGPNNFEIEILQGVEFLNKKKRNGNVIKVDIHSDFHKGLTLLPEEPIETAKLKITFDDVIQ